MPKTYSLSQIQGIAMTRALHAAAQGRLVGLGLSGALVLSLSLAPAAWAATSNQQNPTATFTTPGTKEVTLQVCNSVGDCSSVTQTLTLLDPKPAVTASSFAPLVPEAGQLILLTGAGTGKPPLAFSWQVAPVGGSPVASFSGTSVWWNTAGVPPGAYTVSFKIDNGSGSAVVPLPLTLAPAAALDFYTVEPCRLYDSRLGLVPVQSGVAKTVVATGGGCGIPAGARAVAANVTVIDPSNGGYATFYPGNYPQPVVSMVNFSAGGTRSNNATLPLATNGAGTLTALLSMAGANGSANLTIDVSGYYMP
jgi:hypothetical protein